jgi:hypothetical protein
MAWRQRPPLQKFFQTVVNLIQALLSHKIKFATIDQLKNQELYLPFVSSCLSCSSCFPFSLCFGNKTKVQRLNPTPKNTTLSDKEYSEILISERNGIYDKHFLETNNTKHCYNVIFVDMDGVLATTTATPKSETINDRIEASKTIIDPDKVTLLEKLVEAIPNCIIIISSDWRKKYTLNTFKESFLPTLSHRIMGKTDFDKSKTTSIVKCINAFFHKNYIVVLDDDPKVAEKPDETVAYSGSFIYFSKTSYHIGLTETHTANIRDFFNTYHSELATTEV